MVQQATLTLPGVGAVLSSARAAAGLTQEELADRSGLSVRAIRNLESGRTGAPRRQSAGLLAGVLGVPRGQLLPQPPGPISGDAGTRQPVLTYRSELPAVHPAPVGRDAALARLCGLLTGLPGDAAARLAVVTGPPGAGKTATVAHAARLLSRSFPDRQVYIDLEGQPGEPMTAAAVAVRVLRSFGMEPPPSAEEATARVRAALAGHRAIVVLDSAVSEAQVRPLICASGRSAVLVAACRTLPALAAPTVPLGPLGPVDAVALLSQVAGAGRTAAEPDAALRIAQSCDYLPLALHIAGLWLAARPHRRLRELAARLADETGRLDLLRVGDLSLRASVAAACRRLTQPQRAALLRLAGLTGYFSAGDAAALLGLAEHAAADLLDDLVHGQVAEARTADDGEPARYRLPDSVRLHAADGGVAGPARSRSAIARAW